MPPCPLCAGVVVASFTGPRGPIGRCTTCGVLFAVSPDTRQDHAELFYSTIDEAAYVGYFEPFRKAQYRDVLSALSLPKGSRHLDIGAGHGWMVEVGLDLGFDSVGIEPGETSLGSDRVRGRITHISLEDYAAEASHRFDLITLWHVLEHLPDPVGAIRQIKRLLGDAGRLVVAVPNAEGRMFRLALALERVGMPQLATELWYFKNPNMHYFYYSPQALTGLLQREGIQPARVFTLDAFDWTTMHRRVKGSLAGAVAKVTGPLVAASRLTRRENLVAVASLRPIS
jgi:2-polyprenyl-3-methyl-5-hydroxy-6-metoxy-1,4-benzoquinol methylase